MASLYATLIIKKRKKFEDVPESLQEAVVLELLERGYDTSGDPITTE